MKTLFHKMKQFGSVYFLEKNIDLLPKEIHNILINISKNKHDSKKYLKINSISCLLYNLSYCNYNIKNILIKSNQIISSQFNFIKEKVVLTKKKRIKILFIAFYILGSNGNITSVFRDRSQTILKLNPTIFEKYVLTAEPNKNNSNPYLKEFFNCNTINFLYLEKINIHRGFIDFINKIRDAQFDIVVYPSIGMCSYNTLFANNRLAPIQINTWGHSRTSGIDTIDYYISSKLYEVENVKEAQKNYSEKLICLNSLGTCYLEYCKDSTFLDKKTLNLPNNKIILCCLQSLIKINNEFINTIQTILNKIPNSIILLREDGLSTQKKNYVQKTFNNNIIWVKNCTLIIYNSYIYHSDLVLDPYPFGGCNGSLEAFAKGKIIITRPSKYLPGRFTYGFYKKMGIMDAVVHSYDEYIDKVVYYIEHTDARKELEQRILSKKDILFNDQDSMDEWSDTLIELYRKDIDTDFIPNKEHTINPIEVLDYNRYDLIFKYIYIKYSAIFGTFNNWTQDIYKQHIQLLNGCYEMKTLYQREEKNIFNDFLVSFQLLIHSFNENNYNADKIPVNITHNTYHILNGAHRTACSIYFNKPLLIEEKHNSTQWICKADYFKNRDYYKHKLPHPGKDIIQSVNEDYVDFSIIEYIKLNKTKVRIISFFDRTFETSKKNIVQYIESVGANILYEKKVYLNSIGMKNFIRECYLTETFVNIDLKTNACFNKKENSTIHIIIIESNNKNTLHKFSDSGAEYKTKLRKDFNNHHSLHVTDNDEDTIRLAKTLFNKNTIEFYNTLDHSYNEDMLKMFNHYKSLLHTPENYCITSSFILGLYKLREPNDIDYIHNDAELLNIASHNTYTCHYPYELKEILYNPKHYFYFHGFKCCTLDILKQFKLKRNEIPKDIHDLDLINNHLDGDKILITKNNNSETISNEIINTTTNIITNNFKSNITILILTNKTQKSLKCLELLLHNIHKNIPELNNCTKIICHDFNKNDTEEYYEQLNNLTKIFEHTTYYIGNRTFMYKERDYSSQYWGCNILDLITKCPTPYFLFCEHDWIFTDKINIKKILKLFDEHTSINTIKFNKRSKRGPLDNYYHYIKKLNLTKICNLTNWPYISRQSIWIESWIDKLIKNNIITTIEHNINFETTTILDLYNNWGLYMYGKFGDQPLIRHTDGRDVYTDEDKGLSITHINNLLNNTLNDSIINNKVNLFQNSGNIKLELEPFPHIVIKNALPERIYNKLYNEFPRIEYFNEGGMQFGNNYPIFKNCSELLNDHRVSDIWKEFVHYQSSPEFFEQCVTIFKSQIEKYYSDKIDFNTLNKDNCCKRNEGTNDWILDSQIRINTPVLQKSTIISPHCDNPYKLYVGLFYMPVQGDDAGGNLHLYKMKDQSINIADVENKRFIDEKYIDIYKTIKYEPNTFVLFMNSNKSIHGVQQRDITLNIRRLCTFSASYKNKLFNMYDKKED